MHDAILVKDSEPERGCGFRKRGGLYLVSDGEGRSCGRLPIPLTTCPCCGEGIRHNQGWRYVDLDKLSGTEFCAQHGSEHCGNCPFSRPMGKAGLLWVGQKTPSGKGYASTKDFTDEAAHMGISRRISTVPREFKVGETWVALASVVAIKNPEPPPVEPQPPAVLLDPLQADAYETALESHDKALAAYKPQLPGIFYLFKPNRIERVLHEHEVDDRKLIDDLVRRGITPVFIKGLPKSKNDDEGEEVTDPLFNRPLPSKKPGKPAKPRIQGPRKKGKDKGGK